jgi:hypothetical protein
MFDKGEGQESLGLYPTFIKLIVYFSENKKSVVL